MTSNLKQLLVQQLVDNQHVSNLQFWMWALAGLAIICIFWAVYCFYQYTNPKTVDVEHKKSIERALQFTSVFAALFVLGLTYNASNLPSAQSKADSNYVKVLQKAKATNHEQYFNNYEIQNGNKIVLKDKHNTYKFDLKSTELNPNATSLDHIDARAKIVYSGWNHNLTKKQVNTIKDLQPTGFHVPTQKTSSRVVIFN